jgi:hypothetical protein
MPSSASSVQFLSAPPFGSVSTSAPIFLCYNCCIATYLKEIYMYDFEKEYKKFEELADRTKQAYEFWYNCLVSTWKDFYSKKK